MNDREFIVALLDKGGTEILVLVLVISFYRPIRALLRKVRKLSWGDKEAHFRDELEDAEDKLIDEMDQAEAKPSIEDNERIAAPDERQAPGPSERIAETEFESLIGSSPALAVVSTWGMIERELERISLAKGYPTSQSRSTTFVLRRLERDGEIAAPTIALINDLRQLRNIAIHGTASERAVTDDDARRYKYLADNVLDKLKAL